MDNNKIIDVDVIIMKIRVYVGIMAKRRKIIMDESVKPMACSEKWILNIVRY